MLFKIWLYIMKAGEKTRKNFPEKTELMDMKMIPATPKAMTASLG